MLCSLCLEVLFCLLLFLVHVIWWIVVSSEKSDPRNYTNEDQGILEFFDNSLPYVLFRSLCKAEQSTKNKGQRIYRSTAKSGHSPDTPANVCVPFSTK